MCHIVYEYRPDVLPFKGFCGIFGKDIAARRCLCEGVAGLPGSGPGGSAGCLAKTERGKDYDIQDEEKDGTEQQDGEEAPD